MGELPVLSVIVASRNRAEGLATVVADILGNDHERFELLVVDQSDNASRLSHDERLRYIYTPGVAGKSRGLNEGIRQSKGRILAFTDDDCTVAPGWLRKGERLLRERPEVDLVFGALLACPHDPTEAFVPEFRPPAFRTVRGASHAHIRGGAGANLFARREVFDAVGLFDERIGPGERFRSCEEFDLYYRALRAGFCVAQDPANAVIHWGARPYADGTGQQLLRGYYYGEGAVLAKHLRCGDVMVLGPIVRIAGEQTRATVANLLLRRKLTGVGRAAYWVRGLSAASRAGVRRRERLFV
ncbi:MAG: glycosyltransferase [Dehalococcoidia bacterium]|nr:glycosyltransferase [Dehalococcoidia bacterium]